MSAPLAITMTWSDWLLLFQQYLVLSMLSVGGGASTLPEIHRFLVGQQHWITTTQFNSSVAIAYAAPGPNVLFYVLLAWNVGINAASTTLGGVGLGLLSVAIAIVGILLPSSALTLLVSDWLQRHQARYSVQAFKQGLAPIVIALLIAIGWIMASTHAKDNWRLWAVTAVTVAVILLTRIHLLWLIAIGAVLGWIGVI